MARRGGEWPSPSLATGRSRPFPPSPSSQCSLRCQGQKDLVTVKAKRGRAWLVAKRLWPLPPPRSSWLPRDPPSSSSAGLDTHLPDPGLGVFLRTGLPTPSKSDSSRSWCVGSLQNRTEGAATGSPASILGEMESVPGAAPTYTHTALPTSRLWKSIWSGDSHGGVSRELLALHPEVGSWLRLTAGQKATCAGPRSD